jgi:1,4-alpha-glucan branching enzyme
LKSPEKAAVVAPAAKSTAPKTLSVRFALHKPDAKRVSLCGEFNGWSPTATPMKRQNDGVWETTVALAPGSYQYKFVVDGEWIADPAAQKNVPNEHGSRNSLIEVQP